MSPRMSVAAAPTPGAFAPFAHRAFALLWTATLISNVGTWMRDVGGGWLMTTLTPSPALVTLVQAATTMPVFLFALVAGTLADRVDRRRMLIAINAGLLVLGAVQAVIVWAGQMTPTLLISLTFLIGTGTAFMAPAWQAVVPQLVPRETLKPAIALNSMGINISRAIGPAVGGVLIASVGLAAPFALNAASYLVIIAALVLWRASPRAARGYTGSMASEMATGLRHVRHNGPMNATLVRAFAFFLFASAYWSLLPLIARQASGGGSELYGTLMGLIGVGAVAGALVLPTIQRRLTTDQAARIGTVGTAIALAILAMSASAPALMAAALLGGLSWIAVLTSFNVAAQLALPDWVRARGLAVFLMVFFGSMALGSILWGQLASFTSVPTALWAAASGLFLGLVATRGFSVGQAEDMDFAAASMWPQAPVLDTDGSPDRPAMVTVEYHVAKDDRADFLEALRAFSRERLRDGATRWYVHRSIEDPLVWIETFHLPSWNEHLEQHARVTRHDADMQESLRNFDIRATGPLVRHFISPA